MFPSSFYVATPRADLQNCAVDFHYQRNADVVLSLLRVHVGGNATGELLNRLYMHRYFSVRSVLQVKYTKCSETPVVTITPRYALSISNSSDTNSNDASSNRSKSKSTLSSVAIASNIPSTANSALKQVSFDVVVLVGQPSEYTTAVLGRIFTCTYQITLRCPSASEATRG